MAGTPTSPSTALVIDGDLFALRRLLSLLADAGWDCRGAPDVVEAHVVLGTFVPRLVILDPDLPLAGEIIAHLRARFAPRVVALCATGTVLAIPALWDGQLFRPANAIRLQQVLRDLDEREIE